jgi:Mg2+/Co2+ transporter CorB
MTALKTLIAVIVALLALGVLAATAAAETSVRLLGRGRTRRLAESGARGASALDVLAERPGRVSASHALVAGIAFATVAALGVWVLERAWAGTPGWIEVIASTCAATVLLFVFGEALPRFLATANAEEAGLASASRARSHRRGAGWCRS